MNYIWIYLKCLFLTKQKKNWTSFGNIFRPSVVTKNYYGIFVFSRNNENKEKPKKFLPKKNTRSFVQAYLMYLLKRLKKLDLKNAIKLRLRGIISGNCVPVDSSCKSIFKDLFWFVNQESGCGSYRGSRIPT
jgi:hypothetical protein